jgi:hypothetical protein
MAQKSKNKANSFFPNTPTSPSSNALALLAQNNNINSTTTVIVPANTQIPLTPSLNATIKTPIMRDLSGANYQSTATTNSNLFKESLTNTGQKRQLELLKENKANVVINLIYAFYFLEFVL